MLYVINRRAGMQIQPGLVWLTIAPVGDVRRRVVRFAGLWWS